MLRILCFLVVVSGPAFAVAQTVTVVPAQPWIERTKLGQSLSFDLIIDNAGGSTLALSELRLRVFDRKGNLVIRKQAWSGIDAVLPASPTIAPRAKLLVLNPFHLFDASVELARLEYDLVLQADREGEPPKVVTVAVMPRAYRPKVKLGVPVGGRVLVYEGHDFHAHHRRVDLTNPMVAKLGVTTNPTRYSYDFCVVDARGALFANQGTHNEDWLGFGAPILSPGAGIVREIRNQVDDNLLGRTKFDMRLALQDLKAFYGNYVAIDHGNSELSILAHLKKGSVTVKPGDRVKAGQPIAQMGLSGDSDFVHVHYQLQRSLEINNEALPSYFDHLKLIRGTNVAPAGDAALASGDIVERAN